MYKVDNVRTLNLIIGFEFCDSSPQKKKKRREGGVRLSGKERGGKA